MNTLEVGVGSWTVTSVRFGSNQDGRLPEEAYTHTLREERLVTALLSFRVPLLWCLSYHPCLLPPYDHTLFMKSQRRRVESRSRHCWTVLLPVDTVCHTFSKNMMLLLEVSWHLPQPPVTCFVTHTHTHTPVREGGVTEEIQPLGRRRCVHLDRGTLPKKKN